jgi:hypothetical protein
MVRDKILALDLATRWGWAVLDTGGRLHGWGAMKCSPTKAMTRWTRFRRQLATVVSPEVADELAEVVVESADGKRWRSASAARVLFGLHAHVEHWADLRGAELIRIPQATVKLEATGDGHAEKVAVAKACCEWFPDRGIEGLIEAGGPFDGTDAIAVGLARVALLRRDQLDTCRVVR